MHPDIKQSHTIESDFYRNPAVYQQVIEKVLLHSWQWIGDKQLMREYNAVPITLLEGSVDEPLLLTKDNEGEMHCLSNVCTHRGKILVEQPQQKPLVSCGYHGRCFLLNGQFRSMPEFKEALHFPSAEDHLPQLPLARLGLFLFTALQPAVSFDTVFAPLLKRMDWFDFEALIPAPEYDKTYEITANWALYCDNYLEGFHVPFVHPGLNEQLDYQQYNTEVFDYCNVQIGIADKNSPCFDLPAHSPDYGKRIYAYYWWVFPNLMINIYTWGISINVVLPQAINRTRIVFKTYLLPGKSAADVGVANINQTEMEDEAVVESVQRGIQSRLYRRGRFSPSREQGVHHFHWLLKKMVVG